MNCSICGVENQEAGKFCGQCGGPMELATAPVVPQVPEPDTVVTMPVLAPAAHSFGRNWMGAVQVGFLLTALTAIFVGAGAWIGGTGGAAVAFVLALGMNFGSYWFSDRLVLMTTGAHEVTPEQAPQLHQIVEELAARADLPKPRVCVMHDLSPNAFATGRDPRHGVVAVTTGLMQVVQRDHLEGIIAHELAHIKHRDMLLSSMVAALAGAVMFLGYVARWGGYLFADDDEKGNLIALLIFGLIAPFGAMLVQLGISRAREYKADEGGAYICGNPHALANALERLEQVAHQQPLQINPAASHLFIVPPAVDGWFGNLFRTHPSTASRAERLRKMAG
jgi:heat shock protein HtpX